jgi:hypothetical protein
MLFPTLRRRREIVGGIDQYGLRVGCHLPSIDAHAA